MIVGDENNVEIFKLTLERNTVTHSPSGGETKENTDYLGKSQKPKTCRTTVTHRGCSKFLFEIPKMIREVKQQNEMFLKAEHGNYGDDAFFIVQTENFLVFGIADGVGGWSKEGIDPAIFSASLVKHACKKSVETINAIEQLDNSDSKDYNICARSVMQVAYDSLLRYEGDMSIGSATACFGAYNYKTKELNIANLGDSGIYIRTNSKFEFLSEQMQHSYNYPYQLTNPPVEERKKSIRLDSPKDAIQYDIKLSEGDYFIVGSDGVWDNVDIQNMRTSLDLAAFKLDDCSKNEMNKQTMTENFANDFFKEVMLNSSSPFSYERLNNYENPFIANHGRFYGAKKDDISLIIVMV